MWYQTSSILLYQNFGRRRDTKENESLLQGMAPSVKGQGEGWDVFFAMFFTGKSAFAEKSLRVLVGKLNRSQQYAIPNHM